MMCNFLWQKHTLEKEHVDEPVVIELKILVFKSNKQSTMSVTLSESNWQEDLMNTCQFLFSSD